ncbi:hypothetical protein Pan216_52800 [Planctomycetes bacterium Pan216]|uniref:Heparinase II/III-like protein n=1 Tax=Kolteria novifilia TaxID=2527975 RepID=A0A518BBN1_9BACT|nr:hypothetical protein Pan216_52800 [Planctomycetes bacterium Pan216]
MDKAERRRLTANLRKVRKFFPHGYLDEEQFAFEAFLEEPEDSRQIFFAPAWPWADSPPESSIAEEVTGHSGEGDGASLVELLRVEASIAEWARDAEKASLPKGCGDRLGDWLKTHVAPDGLFREDPWITFAILPSLWRIRGVLQELAWKPKWEKVFQAIVPATIRCCAGQGWIGRPEAPCSEGMAQLLADLVTEKPLRPWAPAVASLTETRTPKRGAPPSGHGMQSDEVDIAVMRKDWSPEELALGLDWNQEDWEIDGRLFGSAFLKGAWEVRVSAGGKPLEQETAWSATCWFSDGEAEYLEAHVKFESGFALDRQLFLARPTDVLWIADTLIAPEESELELEWTLPMPTATGLEGRLPTCAQRVLGLPFELSLTPAAFPPNPMVSSPGSLSYRGKSLVMKQRGRGTRLHMPLVFNWHRKRLPAAIEWRQLSMTNDRRPVPADEAVAFRVTHGDDHVVFFRALTEQKRYAFLGHQTVNECLIGAMDETGTLDEWLIIE